MFSGVIIVGVVFSGFIMAPPPPPRISSHRRIFYEQIMFTLQVGHVQKRQLSPGKVYEIKTLSLRPPIFGKKIKIFLNSLSSIYLY